MLLNRDNKPVTINLLEIQLLCGSCECTLLVNIIDMAVNIMTVKNMAEWPKNRQF